MLYQLKSIALIVGLGLAGAPVAQAVDPAKTSGPQLGTAVENQTASVDSDLKSALPRVVQRRANARTALISLSLQPVGVAARRRELLRLEANGRLHVIAPDGSRMIEAESLPVEEVDSLWSYLTIDEQLLECDNLVLQAELEAAFRQSGLVPIATGGEQTVLTLHRNSQTGPDDQQLTTLQLASLSVMSRRYPDAQWLQRLARADRRLRTVMAIGQVGGREATEALAYTASQGLWAEDPSAEAMTANELTVVRSLSDGSRFVQFSRCLTPESGSNTLLISVMEFPASPPRVTVLSGLPSLR